MIQTQSKTEKALILAEVYKHNEKWKFRFIDQICGVKTLAENFGVVIDETTTNTSPTPTPTPTPTKSNINLSKIKLDKNNSTINLSRVQLWQNFVNLNWNKSAPKSESFFEINPLPVNRPGSGCNGAA